MFKNQNKIHKEFPLSTWAINNSTTIYVLIVVILFLGIKAFYNNNEDLNSRIKNIFTQAISVSSKTNISKKNDHI